MVNRVILIGNLGRDPELRQTQNGKAVCNFPIATTEKFNNAAGEKQERVEWHSIVCWGKLAEVCGQYLAKGRTVFVEGRLATRSWDGKDGAKHYKTEVVAEQVKFLGGGSGEKGKGKERPESATTDSGDRFESEMPF